MDVEEELHYLLALQRVPNLGDISAKKLLARVGSAKAIFKSSKESLNKIEGIGPFKLKGLNEKIQLVEAEKELQFALKQKVKVLAYSDANFPQNLLHCPDSPLVLFYKGSVSFKERKIISIVGTRNATPYGKNFCESLIKTLAPYDLILVSGMAYGIDIKVHTSCLKHGVDTVGCLAHGLHTMYPKSHSKYVSEIIEKGGFLTEFWSNDSFDRTNFLRRNRIIAGIAEATIVIESGIKGGSLVTADIANSYSRDVFALPGNVNDTFSKGCNGLIKQHKAQAITTPEDIPLFLNWNKPIAKKATIQTRLFVDLTNDEQQLVTVLQKHKHMHIDALSIAANLPSFKVASILMNLELKGIIQTLPGKIFKLN